VPVSCVPADHLERRRIAPSAERQQRQQWLFATRIAPLCRRYLPLRDTPGPISLAKRAGLPSQNNAGVLEHVDAIGVGGKAKVTFCSPGNTVIGVVCCSLSSAFESCSRITGASPSVGSSNQDFGCIMSARANGQHLLFAAGKRACRLALP